jgi:hypothetical protein
MQSLFDDPRNGCGTSRYAIMRTVLLNARVTDGRRKTRQKNCRREAGKVIPNRSTPAGTTAHSHPTYCVADFFSVKRQDLQKQCSLGAVGHESASEIMKVATIIFCNT